VKLRPHQEKAIAMLRQSLQTGHKRPLLAAPTAFGKTITAAYIAKSAVERGKRVVFIADRVKLVNQALEAMDVHGIDAGVIQADHWRTDYSKPVQIASWQTLAKKIEKHGTQAFPFDLAIVDECHTIYKSMTDIMGQLNLIPFIGLSATPYTKGLGLVWDDLLVPVTPRELLAEGYLCPADYYGGHKISVEGVKSRTVNGVTDYDPTALAEAVEGDTQLVGGVIDNWLKHANGRQTVAFTPSIIHSKALVREFQDAGISAEHVDGYMDHQERDDIIEAHNNGEFTILSCSRLLNTGWDSPITSCIIDCFPTRSISTYVQRIGRGLRTAEDKTECIVLDHAQNVSRFGFAEDWYPTKLDDGSDKYNEKKLTNQDEEKTEPKVRDCPQCYREFIGIRCSCGYEIPIKEQIETTQEELQKLEKAEAKMATKEDKISFYAQLKNYAHQKNYNPSWACHKYREKFGTWYGYGNKHNLPMETITPEVQSWITSRQIAWAKGKDKVA
jgi:superfamily II DNA or RNA helicase